MHLSDNCDGVELNFSLPNEASKVNYHGNKGIKTAIYVMFKIRAAVFYWDLKPRGAAEWFYTRYNTCCEFFQRVQKHSWKSVCQESS